MQAKAAALEEKKATMQHKCAQLLGCVASSLAS